MVRVIGLGQRVAGDDGVGLCVLDALEQDPPAGVELCRVADAAQLVELVQGAERVVVVDAAVAAGPPGTVRTPWHRSPPTALASDKPSSSRRCWRAECFHPS